MPAHSDLSFADTLWKSADALRGQVDAAEYKHVEPFAEKYPRLEAEECLNESQRLATVIRQQHGRIVDAD